MPGNERFRDLDIDQFTANRAVHMIVPFDPGVVATGRIGKCEFLDLAMLRQQVKRPVHSSVGDARVLPPNALENLTRGQMIMRFKNGIEDHQSLGRVSVCLCSFHRGPFAH